MGTRKSQKESERFRSWTQHIYQHFSSVLDDIALDDRSQQELPEFASGAYTDIEKESLLLSHGKSRSVRDGRDLPPSGNVS